MINKEKFQRGQAAYEILSDPEKKENYDIKYAAMTRGLQKFHNSDMSNSY